MCFFIQVGLYVLYTQVGLYVLYIQVDLHVLYIVSIYTTDSVSW